ncbi:MAG: zinc-binding alcohol dehydrogenase [Anaerolineales bacterium]
MSKAQTLYFTSPKQTEIIETNLPTLKADEVLVETICSAISAGTEMLVYRGQFPQLVDSHDAFSSDLKYPVAYGYACVGKVIETGKNVAQDWLNKIVFAFQPHTSAFIAQPTNLIPIPASLSPQAACFLPNMETAVNLVQDGAPILGEKVLVLGQGIIGLLTASLLSEFPLENLVTVDQFELRRNALLTGHSTENIKSVSPEELRRFITDEKKADLTFELSGSPAALNDAIECTTFSGRIVIGSWYGQKRAPIDLGGSFHRSRIKLIASQVSSISPDLSGRWDKARRFEVTWKALERIQPEKWITQRFSLDEADKAYQLLDEKPQETIQVIFQYSK